MKEELIRVLNHKLDNINNDITSLNELNGKIDEENEVLDFVNRILDLFKNNGVDDPMNFDKVSNDDFLRILDITGEEVKKLFSDDVCNYDGLVYLISGIKNGISITLTNEQTNSIEFLIQSLLDKKKEIENTVSGYRDEVSGYEISDVSELENKKENYIGLKENIERNEYIKDIDIIKEAINYSSIEPSEVIKMLSYVLEYNAKLYKDNKPITEDIKEETEENNTIVETEEEEETSEDTSEETNEEASEETKEIDIPSDNEFHFEQINNDEILSAPITFNDLIKTEEEKEEEVKEIPTEQISFGESLDNSYNNTNTDDSDSDATDTGAGFNGFKSFDEIINNSLKTPSELDYVPLTDYEIPEPQMESDVELPVVEPPMTFNEEEKKEENTFDNDYQEEMEPVEEVRDEKAISTRELHKIFGKYGIEENVILNELIDGDINEYQAILDSLKDHSILDDFKKNKELLIETLLYSNTAVIDRVLNIVKEDLSTDDEDYEITLKIVINTIPSIFIKEGGNYDNFIANTELFKHLELNLINLFDFSKEVFIADSEAVRRNYDIVKEYDFDITYQNAKYFLLIPNIEDKLDYYIESVYEDKLKNETFDGINYIKEFAAKLNVVTDETIKRLRYASINGKKVFGSKPGALTGEITNLKVNTLEMNDIYLNSFFDNEFKDITPEEVREYVKLTRNSTNVGDYSDELDKLDTYRNGLRYTIEGVNVSYNKVVRNYNILRSYGIDAKKALQYAVCHNLVITKDEYSKLSELLDKIGGNI